MSFDTLGLSEKVLAAVAASGYREPTPIQAGAIPHVLDRKDVLGIAQTGTGKTASFVLPMLTLLEKGRARARMPRTLILEPTRELAAQVEENFVKYGINHKLTVALLIGGVSFEEQTTKLSRGVDVLIATPGRLLDLCERGKVLMQGVEILVIDEADRMLDMGFIPDIERICKLIPPTRQTLFFSATMPPEITRLADNFLKSPVRVEVSKPASTVDTVTQLLVSSPVDAAAKRDTLRRLMRGAEGLKNAIIFCNRKRDVATLYRSLEKHGFSVGALHGDMDQRARTQTLEAFRKNELTFLVASDVAARGLDIPDVSHVYNFDVPHHAEDYVHRIGRTGRAGRAGASFTIVTGAEKKSLAAIEKLIGKPIPWAGEPVAADAAADDGGERRSSRGRRGGRSESNGESRGEAEARPEGGRGRGRRGGSRAEAAPTDVVEAQPVPAVAEAVREEIVAVEEPAPLDQRPARTEDRPARADGAQRQARGGDRMPRDNAGNGDRSRDADRGRQGERSRDGERPRDGERSRDGDRNRGPRRDDQHADANRRSRGRDRGRDRDDDPPVIGLGDHVPAFLLRPVRLPRPTRLDETEVDEAEIETEAEDASAD